MPGEVRYERLRPHEIVAAREACPAAYVPVGTIEWHGVHNPVGLDTMKIYGICRRCAQAGGGLVFPPLFYGENREEALLEANPDTGPLIAEAMHLPEGTFAPGYMKRSPAEQSFAYHRLLLHILREVKSLGFRVIVLAAGHYPLLDHARAAACVFHQEQRGRGPRAIPWVFTGYELVCDRFPDAGDHGGKWETSLMMALDRERVDLSQLHRPRPDRLLGAGLTAYESTVEFGEQALRAIVEKVTAEVRARLDHPEQYLGHGLKL